VLSGCLNSEPGHAARRDEAKASQIAKFYGAVGKENYYLNRITAWRTSAG
jgi:hypothetical protein